jgi:hypothetical protein
MILEPQEFVGRQLFCLANFRESMEALALRDDLLSRCPLAWNEKDSKRKGAAMR